MENDPGQRKEVPFGRVANPQASVSPVLNYDEKPTVDTIETESNPSWAHWQSITFLLDITVAQSYWVRHRHGAFHEGTIAYCGVHPMGVLFQRTWLSEDFPCPSTLSPSTVFVSLPTWTAVFKARGNFLSSCLIPEWVKRSLLMITGLETAGHPRILKTVDRPLPLWPVKRKGHGLGEKPLHFNPVVSMTSHHLIPAMQEQSTSQNLPSIPTRFALQPFREWEELI